MAELTEVVAQFADLSDVAAVHAALTEKLDVELFPLPPYIDDLPADVAAKIRKRAILKVSAVDRDGIPEPTKEEVADVIKAIQQKRDAGEYWSRVQNAVGLRLDAGDSREQLQAVMAAVPLEVE